MKRNPRASQVARAKVDLELLILKFAGEHDMTDIELLQALTSMQQSTLKYMLREERHGDQDTPADLTKED